MWERLSAIPRAACGDASIELEPLGETDAADLITMRRVAALWNRGVPEQAVTLLRQLEESGAPMGLGISWKHGTPSALRDGVDVRIGPTHADGEVACLDFDAATGHLFAVVRWGSTTGVSSWTVNMSSTHGHTWTETYSYNSSVGIVDVDAAVVGGYVYIGYIVGNATSEVRTRRSTVSDGVSDSVYGFHTAIAAAASTTFSDVAVAANADDFDNRIYVVAIQSDRSLRYAWDVASDGTTFTDVSPAAIANASAGLDATFDHNFVCTDYLFVSYAGSEGYVHVLRLAGSTWTDVTVETNVGAYRRTSISAYGSTVICAFEMPMTHGVGIQYQISYDCGVGWSVGFIAIPDGVTYVGFYSPSVDARSGLGTSIVYQAEMGEPDLAYYQVRAGYAPGTWRTPVPFNDFDVSSGTPTALSTLSFRPANFDQGAIYMNGAVYFDRPGEGVVDAPVVAQGESHLRLLPAAPNPFGDRTSIRFVLPAAGPARLAVFDVLGRHVATLVDGPLDAGAHEVPLDAARFGSGVYFYRLTAGNETREGRITVVR
ncbi:MAG: T9SS type A sorting domain-containing protein [bacterium]